MTSPNMVRFSETLDESRDCHASIAAHGAKLLNEGRPANEVFLELQSLLALMPRHDLSCMLASVFLDSALSKASTLDVKELTGEDS